MSEDRTQELVFELEVRVEGDSKWSSRDFKSRIDEKLGELPELREVREVIWRRTRSGETDE